ncbi:MAG: transcriptional regulator [Acidobacteria bacterium]|nr:transcriptional regulator [Acidobacteriota bacterium]
MRARTENTTPRRRSALAVGAIEDIAKVLSGLGFVAEPGAGRGDLVVRAGREAVPVEVEFAATPSTTAIGCLIAARRRRGPVGVRVLVADRVPLAGRELLRAAGWGWLDRRGHLRLWAPGQGLLVETAVESLLPASGSSPDPIRSRVRLEVAISLLLDPAMEVSVRALSRSLGRAPSAVSVALADLRGASLVTAGSKPLVPELFDEVAGHWAPERTPLGGAPSLEETRLLQRPAFNVEDLDSPGWALTDTQAARHYGAPVVVAGDQPPDFYVPSARALRDAVNQFGLAPVYEARACTVSIPPVGAAVCPRYRVADTIWPLAHPLFVGLELARDRSRGREILDGWTPHVEFTRVW